MRYIHPSLEAKKQDFLNRLSPKLQMTEETGVGFTFGEFVAISVKGVAFIDDMLEEFLTSTENPQIAVIEYYLGEVCWALYDKGALKFIHDMPQNDEVDEEVQLLREDFEMLKN